MFLLLEIDGLILPFFLDVWFAVILQMVSTARISVRPSCKVFVSKVPGAHLLSGGRGRGGGGVGTY